MFLLATHAFAQDLPAAPEWNAQLFRPAIDATSTFWTTTTETPSRPSPGGQALVHYADTPLAYRPTDGDVVRVVGSVGELDVTGWFGGDGWRIGALVPVILQSQSDVVGPQSGLGDVGVEGKGVLFRDPAFVNLGVTGRLDLPTATVDGSLGARNVGYELAAVADQTLGRVLVAANVGVRGTPRTALENITLDDFLVLRGAAVYLVDGGGGVSIEASAQPALSAELTNPAAVPAEWTAGAFVPLADGVVGRFGFGTGLTPGAGAPDWRLMLGLAARPANQPEDYDGDGVLDRADPCMTEPEDVDGVRDEDGCPDLPPRLFARVVDDEGEVVESAVVVLVAPSGEAQPLPTNALTTIPPGAWTIRATADGYTPGSLTFDVAPDAEGTVTALVRTAKIRLATVKVRVVGPDGQPLADGRIRVRGEEVGAAPDWEGTLAPGDAIFQAKVPGYKAAKAEVVLVAGETREVVLSLQPAKAELTNDRIELKESVFFDTGKATIQERSFALLQEVAEVLGQYPQIQKLKIEGHTDSRGDAKANLDLSARRAAAVLDWLVAHGVAKERLVSEGFGEAKPLDARNVAEAWEKNRRVDLVVAEWVDTPR